MSPLESVDDLPSPKVLGLGCEYCPFDYQCEGICILGFQDYDDENGYAPATVGS
jgi:hypothetical protein